MKFRINIVALVNASIKFLFIGFLWQLLELILYHQIQPRFVDDIISLFLFYYIFRAEERKRY